MNKELLEKFRKGECSPEEIVQVILWYQSEESESSLAREVEELWDKDEIEFTDMKDVFRQIKKKIKEVQPSVRAYSKYRSPQPLRRKKAGARLALTSLFILLVMVSVAAYFFRDQLFEKDNPVVREIAMIHKEISQGQKLTMKLPDGTVVKINSGSSISYPEVFSKDRRVIQFKGEAFFEVTKDPERPFIIKSGDLSTKVLGTSFNLKAERESSTFEVAVMTGSVQVSHQPAINEEVKQILKPTEQATFNAKERTFQVSEFDPDRVLAWVDGRIVFDNASMDEIIHKLENWYGVKINTNQLRKKIEKGYSGEFKDKSLETVLDGISYVLGFEYDIKDKTVTIK